MLDKHSKPGLVEALGLLPLGLRARQALVALRGAEDVPPARYDLSSLKLLKPRLALPLWAGSWVVPRRAILTNLFNHRQTPIAEGWSVQYTQTEDFRGKSLTYNSHNGTDFSIPVGSRVVAPAPGVVVRVWAEYNRGGHKVAIDHGGGLITSSAHLARPLVQEGQVLQRGQVFAISGYSGLDALVSFPWGIPHIHFNVWLNGQPVDPFARFNHPEASLWLGGLPQPCEGPLPMDPEHPEPTVYDMEKLRVIEESCLTASVREALARRPEGPLRGGYVISERAYYPTRFRAALNPCVQEHPRTPRLSMPFLAEDFDGVLFADELP